MARWLIGRWRKLAGSFVLLVFLSVNGLAYLHARAMTTFSTAGRRTTSPERLSTIEKAGVLLTGVNLSRPANEQTPADLGLDYAANVNCPTLILHGSRDPRVSVTEVQAVHAQLAGRKQLTLIPRAAHESYLAVDPALWNGAVGEFLGRLQTDSE